MLNKCRRGPNVLLHLDTEDERDLRTASLAKPAEPPDGPTRVQAYDGAQLAVAGTVRAQGTPNRLQQHANG
jgi:hypothetical protein